MLKSSQDVLKSSQDVLKSSQDMLKSSQDVLKSSQKFENGCNRCTATHGWFNFSDILVSLFGGIGKIAGKHL